MTIPPFQMIWRNGLVMIAILFALVVAAIAYNHVWPLTFLHVGFGAAWTVIDLYAGLLIGPIVARMPVQARLEFLTRFMPKMLLLMPAVVTVTLAAGWQLGVLQGTVLSSYPHHAWTVASYIVVAVIAVVSLGMLSPANLGVLFELKKPRPNPAVVERLTKRFIYCARIIGILQLGILLIMTRLATF